MENLPKNVAIQWREWCARKDYFFDKRFYGKSVPTGNFKNYDFPIRVFWTVDDTISNKKNTENYWKHVYSSKGIDFTRITPKEYGLKKIDHFGFFKKIMKDKLWVQIAAQLDDWLED